MTAETLLQKMRALANSSEHMLQFSALLFALQIPSICSRREFPCNDENIALGLYKKNGTPQDKELYFCWIHKHKDKFLPWYATIMTIDDLCEYIYALRNCVTHTGNLYEVGTNVLLVEASENINGLSVLGTKLLLSVGTFCNKMFDIADETFSWNEAPKLDLITINIYRDIYNKTSLAWKKFWKNRQDDLELYRRFCFAGDPSILRENKSNLTCNQGWRNIVHSQPIPNHIQSPIDRKKLSDEELAKARLIVNYSH